MDGRINVDDRVQPIRNGTAFIKLNTHFQCKSVGEVGWVRSGISMADLRGHKVRSQTEITSLWCLCTECAASLVTLNCMFSTDDPAFFSENNNYMLTTGLVTGMSCIVLSQALLTSRPLTDRFIQTHASTGCLRYIQQLKTSGIIPVICGTYAVVPLPRISQQYAVLSN